MKTKLNDKEKITIEVGADREKNRGKKKIQRKVKEEKIDKENHQT